MIRTDDSAPFVLQLREVLQAWPAGCKVLVLDKRAHVYACGEDDDSLYILDSGLVKLLAPTSKTRLGLIALYRSGDLFGESCLIGTSVRQATAIAMKKSLLLKVPRSVFLDTLERGRLVSPMVKYLLSRIADRRRMTIALLAVKKEHRLALTLVYLAHKFGKQTSRGMCIEERIVHEDLAEMTGIRRTRVTMLLRKFRHFGFLDLDERHYIIVRENELTDYLETGAYQEPRDQPEGIVSFPRLDIPDANGRDNGRPLKRKM